MSVELTDEHLAQHWPTRVRRVWIWVMLCMMSSVIVDSDAWLVTTSLLLSADAAIWFVDRKLTARDG